MSTDAITLTAEPREDVGSRSSRRARATGRVPVNVYGHGQGNASLTVDGHELTLALRTTTQLFTLMIDGKSESCLVREVQYDTFGQDVLHVDLTRIDLSEQVEVVVAIDFRGHAAGVAEGGNQSIQHPTLAVRCRADAIPESIVLDVSEMGIGDTVHAGEIELPDGVVLDDNHMAADEPIVSIAAAKAAEVTEEEEAADGDESGAEGGDAPKGDDSKEG